MDWEIPLKPAEIAEKRLIAAILEGHFQINTTLPGERELAEQLGVTRPTLREALQRLARDGWLEIQQGKLTRIRNYWEEGNLAVLAEIAKHFDHLPGNFIADLLFVRKILAPVYAQMAVERKASEVQVCLDAAIGLPDEAEIYAQTDWNIHHQLTIYSGNPIFTLILNGFKDLYPVIGREYFNHPDARARSLLFYQDLLASARANDPIRAESVTREVMEDSLDIWLGLLKGH